MREFAAVDLAGCKYNAAGVVISVTLGPGDQRPPERVLERGLVLDLAPQAVRAAHAHVRARVYTLDAACPSRRHQRNGTDGSAPVGEYANFFVVDTESVKPAVTCLNNETGKRGPVVVGG